MLKVENIYKNYGSVQALNGLSFSCDDGEIFGLLGENGAGKTTTFRIIMGLISANKGTVTLDGNPIDYTKTDSIGFVTEERSLLTKLTVEDQARFYGALKNMSEDEVEKALDYWLERFEILAYKTRKIKELSKGNQQKIQFICAIMNHPKLLILDEPFTGLDPLNVKMLKEAIYDLKKEGCMIIFSSHQMEYIEEFCDKLVILVKGKPILAGRLQEIKKEYGIKQIEIIGDVEKSDFEKIKGIQKIEHIQNQWILHIENQEVVKKVFQAIQKKNIWKFEAKEPTLNEIFIEKVGGAK